MIGACSCQLTMFTSSHSMTRHLQNLFIDIRSYVESYAVAYIGMDFALHSEVCKAHQSITSL